MIIYLVTQGEYSSYCVMGAYTTKEKAEEFKKLIASSNDIAEFEVDKDNQFPKGLLYYEVKINKYGNVQWVHQESVLQARAGPGIEFWRDARDGENLIFEVWAHDETHAIKIANEYRAQAVALNAWESRAVRGWNSALYTIYDNANIDKR